MTPSSAPNPSGPPRDLMLVGTVCGLLSAVGYTASNVMLRSVSGCDPIFVSAIKAFPTVVLVGPWLLIPLSRGQQVLPERRVLGRLACAALLGQLGGNVLFQWSLGVVGIAISVPLCLGTIILGGAILGRLLLHEPLTVRTLVSVGMLITAICALSFGAGAANRSVSGPPPGADAAAQWWLVALGVGAAACSGMAYSILGVTLRYGVTGRASLPATIFITCLVGVVSLGSWALIRLGWSGLWAIPQTDLARMLLAGLFNTAAFLAFTRSLQIATVVYVNALNATQACLAALAGVLLFGEALSPELALGVVLTIAGILLIRRRQVRG